MILFINVSVAGHQSKAVLTTDLVAGTGRPRSAVRPGVVTAREIDRHTLVIHVKSWYMFLHFPFNLIYYKNIFHSLSYVNFIILCNNYISTSSTSNLNIFFFSSLHIQQTVYNRLPFNSEPFSSLNVAAAALLWGKEVRVSVQSTLMYINKRFAFDWLLLGGLRGCCAKWTAAWPLRFPAVFNFHFIYLNELIVCSHSESIKIHLKSLIQQRKWGVQVVQFGSVWKGEIIPPLEIRFLWKIAADILLSKFMCFRFLSNASLRFHSLHCDSKNFFTFSISTKLA